MKSERLVVNPDENENLIAQMTRFASESIETISGFDAYVKRLYSQGMRDANGLSFKANVYDPAYNKVMEMNQELQRTTNYVKSRTEDARQMHDQIRSYLS